MSDWMSSWFASPKANAARTNEALRTLHEMLLLLEKKEAHLESMIALETKKAKAKVAAGDKKAALHALCRRKALEAGLDGLDGRRALLQTQLNAIESAELTARTLAGVQMGTRTLKHLQGDMDMAKVDGVLDAAREVHQHSEDVTSALSAPLVDSMDMSELEAELDAMEQDELNARLDAAVPSYPIPSRPSLTALDDEDEAEELRALQAQMA